MATFNKFNQFVEDLCNAKHDLKTGTAQTFMIMLTNTVPNALDTVVDTTTGTCTVKATSNAPEIAAGNGYAKTGLTCGTVTGSQSPAGTFKFILGTDPVWTAVTGTMGPFQYAVLYNITAGTTSTRPVIGWWAYASAVTLQIGETFTVDLDASNGVLTVA